MYSYPLLYFKQIVKALGYVPSGMKTVLASNVVNQTTAYANVTGLSFPVKSGITYAFTFCIVYDMLDATKSSAWSINGPAVTSLAYMSQAYAGSNYGLSTYNLPAASSGTSAATTANIVTIQGIIKPSADGTVIARSISGVINNDLTAKIGSYVEYMTL